MATERAKSCKKPDAERSLLWSRRVTLQDNAISSSEGYGGLAQSRRQKILKMSAFPAIFLLVTEQGLTHHDREIYEFTA
jgi:hypothetical protein